MGVNKDSYLILDALPAEYDSRVKAMEVDEKPSEDYSDIGGLDKQIQELVEAIVLPITHKDRFKNLGIKPPKGVLLYGPPGTGARRKPKHNGNMQREHTLGTSTLENHVGYQIMWGITGGGVRGLWLPVFVCVCLC